MYASKCLQMYLTVYREKWWHWDETTSSGDISCRYDVIFANLCHSQLSHPPVHYTYANKIFGWGGGGDWAQHVCPSICCCSSICRHNFVQWHACFKKMDFPYIHIDQTIFGHFLLNKSFWNTVLDWSLNLIYILNCKS